MTVIPPAPASPSDGDVQLVEPLLGFPDDLVFRLAAVDTGGTMSTLRSTRDPGLRFIVAAAETFFPGYVVDADTEVRSALAVDDDELLSVLVIVTVTSGLADATANLMAPVVLGHRSRRAIQVLLVDAGLPIAAPLSAGADV